MKKWFVAAYLAALICASAQTYEQKIASAMERVDRVAAKGPFNPDWKSLSKTYLQGYRTWDAVKDAYPHRTLDTDG